MTGGKQAARPRLTEGRSPVVDGATDSAFKVVIAGGGVAAAEAMLALRQLMGDGISIELVSSGRHLSLRPLAVPEPFGLGESYDLRLDVLAREQTAQFRVDSLATVEPDRQVITTESGASIGSVGWAAAATGGGPFSIRTTIDLGMVSVLSPRLYSILPLRSWAESAWMRSPFLRTMVSASAGAHNTMAVQNVIIDFKPKKS